ncbi:hypothetical protein Patl1_14199 [Pistacia atlantica]|uniref:Uncharacterized protein n=1 Tax=Pistacia atlantica TaxID=434234 RepID=A0ACC1AUA5_9ROSI|nr:hypothetical protein Patl1_14199 [Pistacia atlantica]
MLLRAKPTSRHLPLAEIIDPKQLLTEKLLSLLKKCSSTKSLQQIHTQMLIHYIQKPNFLLSKIIELKDVNYASTLFYHLPNPNDYAFNIMIRGFTTTWKKYSLSLQFYYEMRALGLKPNNFTYPFLFISCANLSALNHGALAHSCVFKIGLDGDDHVSHSLITMYARCGELGCARKVFDGILMRDLVSWNSMISGYSKMGYARDAVELFGRMREEGFAPDEITMVSVLGSCGDLGDWGLGRWVEEFVVENKMELNSFMGSALIDMYGKCGDLVSARRVFDVMVKKDVVTWNAIITGYAQNGFSNEAIMLFNGMKEAGVNPDQITLIGVLSACASIGALQMGKCVDTYASERDLQHNIFVATALIDMYAKCGSIENSLRVFEGMPLKNEVSWNAMVSALAFNGRALEALSLFDCMLKDGRDVRPNDITFVGVLSACVHAGLVDEGVGHVHEAWDFIEKMPEKPDEIVLGAMLGWNVVYLPTIEAAKKPVIPKHDSKRFYILYRKNHGNSRVLVAQEILKICYNKFVICFILKLLATILEKPRQLLAL